MVWVDWGVCVEFVVDIVIFIEVICVGCVVDLWNGFEEIMGVIMVEVVVILVVVVECVECIVENFVIFINKFVSYFFRVFVLFLC